MIFAKEAREKLKKGVDAVADAVKVTMGASGRNVSIGKPMGVPQNTKDGVTVARYVDVKDPYEKMGAAMVKEVAVSTVDITGDGTTCATVLTQSIFAQGIDHITKGVSVTDIENGINKATKAVVAKVAELSRKVDNAEIMKQIATVSANNNEELGGIISEVFEKIGINGQTIVQESKNYETSVEYTEGLRIDRGHFAPIFVQDVASQQTVMYNPYVFITEKIIGYVTDIMPIYQQVMRQNETNKENRGLLVICQHLEGEAADFVGKNILNGAFTNVSFIKCPEFGELRTAIMEDISKITGATVLSETTVKPKGATLNESGTAAKVVIKKDHTIIVEGAGNKDALENYIQSLTDQVQHVNEPDKTYIQTRIARMRGGVAIIKVGGKTESEVKERKDRVEDAIGATKSAADEGYVAGGGTTFLHCMDAIYEQDYDNEGEKVGAEIIEKAITEPFMRILANGDYQINIVGAENEIDKARYYANKEYGFGVNMRTRKEADLFVDGIIDPAKVLRVSLEKASSIATLFLKTECLIPYIDDTTSK